MEIEDDMLEPKLKCISVGTSTLNFPVPNEKDTTIETNSKQKMTESGLSSTNREIEIPLSEGVVISPVILISTLIKWCYSGGVIYTP